MFFTKNFWIFFSYPRCLRINCGEKEIPVFKEYYKLYAPLKSRFTIKIKKIDNEIDIYFYITCTVIVNLIFWE